MDKIKEFCQKAIEYEHIFKILVAVIIIIVAFLLFGPKGNNESITLDNENSHQNEESLQSDKPEKKNEGKLYVDISGEVKKPGVYEMSSDSRIFHVIEKAGGFTGKADKSSLNQAEIVKDGQKIIVSKKGDSNNNSEKSGYSSSGSESNYQGENIQNKININKADVTELQKITGVGPSTAKKIIDYRNSNGGFKTIDDLKKVKGIGEKTFSKIKDYITI